MTFAFGWRGILDKDKKLAPYASLDLGYSSSWMQHKSVDADMEYWKQGGSYFSPSLGVLINPHKSTMVFSLGIGYKMRFTMRDSVIPNYNQEFPQKISLQDTR